MSMMAETYLLQAIQTGLSQIQADTGLLVDILDALNANELASAQNYFATAKIKVAPGFPMEQTDMPFIGVTVATMQPLSNRMPIGWTSETINNGNDSTIVQGFPVEGVIKATIYTPNADLIIWLSEVVYWALATQLSFFTEQGFGDVQFSMGDYEPTRDFLPVFTFARGITFSAKWLKSFAATVPNVTSTEITLIDTGD